MGATAGYDFGMGLLFRRLLGPLRRGLELFGIGEPARDPRPGGSTAYSGRAGRTRPRPRWETCSAMPIDGRSSGWRIGSARAARRAPVFIVGIRRLVHSFSWRNRVVATGPFSFSRFDDGASTRRAKNSSSNLSVSPPAFASTDSNAFRI